jgi:hypothetical protein
MTRLVAKKARALPKAKATIEAQEAADAGKSL